MIRARATLLTLLVFALTAFAQEAAWAQSPTVTPSGSPSPGPGSEGLSPATIVIGLILVAAVLLFRTRMGRAGR